MTEDFHTLVDGDLFLPECWSEDHARCPEAGIPDEVVYRRTLQIALELYDRARNSGLTFDWLSCDEGYGSKPLFLQALDDRGQLFVAEVPTTFSCWTETPPITNRPYRRRGRCSVCHKSSRLDKPMRCGYALGSMRVRMNRPA